MQGATNEHEAARRLDAAGRHDDAVDMLARAARRGDGAALTELGRRLVAGDRAPYLPAEGVRLLCDGVRAGEASAAEHLAALTALGAHVPQSARGALDLLAFAAERGSARAREELRVLAPAGLTSASDDPNDTPSRDASVWRALANAVDTPAWTAVPPSCDLHASPRVRSLPDFVDARCAAWLVKRAAGRLERAHVYDALSGANVVHETRTNTEARFALADVDVVQAVLQIRMAAACGVSPRQLEAPAVLHYAPGEEIREHYDFVDPATPGYAHELARFGERIVTFLVYLNDDYSSGETDFPKLGICHKGRRGEGLFFVNALPDGSPDRRMVHAGRAPRDGEKWIVSQFVRNRPVLPAAAAH